MKKKYTILQKSYNLTINLKHISDSDLHLRLNELDKFHIYIIIAEVHQVNDLIILFGWYALLR